MSAPEVQTIQLDDIRMRVPDLRGYGGTDKPTSSEQYTMLHHVGDLVAPVKALGASEAVVGGHEWGAPTAWNAALVRPDLFRAVVSISVPYSPPGRVDLLTALEKQGNHNFYMQYFQTDAAVAELERDVEATNEGVNSLRQLAPDSSSGKDRACSDRIRSLGHARMTSE